MRILIAVALAFTITVAIAPAADAAVIQQPCPLDTFPQANMAGVYIDASIPMRVQVYPCSGTRILWDNPYGRHEAYYATTTTLPGGGLIARGHTPDPGVGYLDNAYTIGVKPAEAGFIQVITVNPYGEFVGVYRLRKIA